MTVATVFKKGVLCWWFPM